MAAKYLTMVGQLQWLVTLGRFDIHAQVATMSRFRAAPRQGHMDRLKRIYSYAIRTKDYAIRFRTEQPDYSFLPDQDFGWTYSVYGNVHEILPDGIDTFLTMFRLCSCGTKPQRSENHHFVMTSSWEPQCHHDIIMRTPRITGKPKFSWSGGP